jgi:hypothetical protein
LGLDIEIYCNIAGIEAIMQGIKHLLWIVEWSDAGIAELEDCNQLAIARNSKPPTLLFKADNQSDV